MHELKQEAKRFIRYWTFPLLRPRRFHAYGVGMAKSGTTSMDGVLSFYRSIHEPEKARFMAIIRGAAEGAVSNSEARQAIKRLDRGLWLEFNSSWLNYFLIDILLEEYPDAKFILTIRDCYSWLDSIINHLLSRKHEAYEQVFYSWYASCFEVRPHSREEKALAERGLHPLDGWLSAWNRHNATVLSKIPQDRLLVVRTQDIPSDIPRISHFLGIPAETLNPSRSHLFKAEKKFGLLAEIDEGFLQEKVRQHCAELMQRYFPEIRTPSDVAGYRQRADVTDSRASLTRRPAAS